MYTPCDLYLATTRSSIQHSQFVIQSLPSHTRLVFHKHQFLSVLRRQLGSTSARSKLYPDLAFPLTSRTAAGGQINQSWNGIATPARPSRSITSGHQLLSSTSTTPPCDHCCPHFSFLVGVSCISSCASRRIRPSPDIRSSIWTPAQVPKRSLAARTTALRLRDWEEDI